MSGNFDYFDYIEENLELIRGKINKAELNRDNRYKCNNGSNVIDKVRLLAATKNVGPEKINFAISRGVNLIGENKVNELLEKYGRINKDEVEIHFIGNLQTNKVKYIIDKVSLIQSVNSIRLAEEINKRAALKNIMMNVLVELNIGGEESKTGIEPESVFEFINVLKDFKNLRVQGLMTIPPPPEKIAKTEKTGKKSEIKKFFNEMYEIFVDIQSKKIDNINMRILSMGMSDDYEDAISCGANIVRIGTALFGKRM